MSLRFYYNPHVVIGRDSDGNGEFFIDRITGVIRTKVSLDHEEKSMYRLSVAATDNGHPPKQTIRMLRVEVLDLNDNRPTFTSSSLVFQVSVFFFNCCFPVNHTDGEGTQFESTHQVQRIR